MHYHNRFPFILLLACLLLVVQFSALRHGVEHLFHAEEASCDSYFAAERQGNALPLAVAVNLPLPSMQNAPSAFSPHTIIPRFFANFSSRAPPFSYS